ncbi:n-acetylneuraminate 9-O-acetyltransferase [Caerostris extrusa]|uniref:N-acetylneuraminate 9-O-acetyltransferase n=1 Tax=Caerostris extrusa TaxID=172846 RepID=A0AAV4W4Q4_CAEEX|nr:n-acetylneuraminate 9-O-acetyltransferase [Caerostris extrusa]
MTQVSEWERNNVWERSARNRKKHINSRNAKILAVSIVIGFIGYHGILHLTSGIDSCKWLLSDGRLSRFRVWQPYGCMMHSYSSGDTLLNWESETHLRHLYPRLLKTKL